MYRPSSISKAGKLRDEWEVRDNEGREVPEKVLRAFTVVGRKVWGLDNPELKQS